MVDWWVWFLFSLGPTDLRVKHMGQKNTQAYEAHKIHAGQAAEFAARHVATAPARAARTR